MDAESSEMVLNRMKEQMDEFLGMASHELRTPLTTIKGNIQLARLRLSHFFHEIDSDSLQNELAQIQMLLDRAERQINVQNLRVRDLLDVVRIQANQFELNLERYELAALMREVVATLPTTSPRRTIRVDLPADETMPVLTDVERMKQVMNHFVTNAIKSSSADYPIDIRLEKKARTARVSVSDQGLKRPHAQENKWDMGSAALQKAQRQLGFGIERGLGLYVSRAIIEQHQGEVGAYDSEGGGATFWFTLPLAREKRGDNGSYKTSGTPR